MKKKTHLTILWAGAIILGAIFYFYASPECGCIFYATALIINALESIFISDSKD